MRLLLSLFWLITTAAAAVAQSAAPPVEIDPRLYEAYEADYLKQLQTDNPTIILRWNFYLDHAFVVSDYPAEKGDISQFPIIRVADPERFNILVLEKEQRLARDWERPMYYRIEGTQKVLMYWSGKDFNRKFQAWLARR